jgi:hypothetical protein
MAVCVVQGTEPVAMLPLPVEPKPRGDFLRRLGEGVRTSSLWRGRQPVRSADVPLSVCSPGRVGLRARHGCEGAVC